MKDRMIMASTPAKARIASLDQFGSGVEGSEGSAVEGAVIFMNPSKHGNSRSKDKSSEEDIACYVSLVMAGVEGETC
jgi:hypothetical protein